MIKTNIQLLYTNIIVLLSKTLGCPIPRLLAKVVAEILTNLKNKRSRNWFKLKLTKRLITLRTSS